MTPGATSRFFRRFETLFVILAPALPIALAAILLMGSARGWAEERAGEHAGRVGQVVSNAAVAPHITREDLDGRELAPRRIAELDRALRPVLSEVILRIRVWDASGRVVYADDPELIDARFPVSQDLAGALEGTRSAESSRLERAESAAHMVEADRLLEVYLPLPGELRGQGAVEFYFTHAQVDREVAQDLRRVAIAMAIGLALLYALLAKFGFDLVAARRQARTTAHEADHDALTGLSNRRHFDRALTDLIENEPQRHLTVLVIDLDDFKRVNDLVGHAGGDELLRALARRLRGAIREDGMVARIGGDEFVVLLPDVQGREEVASIARRLVHDLNAPVRLSGARVHAGASLGSATGRGLTHTADELMRNADAALYLAKSEEKGCHVAFRSGMRTDINSRPGLADELRHAREHDEFQIAFQPVVDNDGCVRAMEALLRWEHPQLGVLKAEDFLPALRRHGLFEDVAIDALERACREAAAWRGDPTTALTVNVSRSQLVDSELIANVVHALRVSGLAPDRLNLELASGVSVNSPSAHDALRRLDSLGIKTWIDSWGVNAAALEQLREIRFDGLKIDGGLVSELSENPRANALVSAAVHMARNLDMGCAAAGVESEAQRDRLRTLGVGLMQGSFISPPLDPVAAARLVADRGRAITRST